MASSKINDILPLIKARKTTFEFSGKLLSKPDILK